MGDNMRKRGKIRSKRSGPKEEPIVKLWATMEAAESRKRSSTGPFFRVADERSESARKGI